MALKATYFEWRDACGQSGWFNAEDTKGLMGVKSIGFIIREDADSITISNGITDDDQFMGYVTVPKSWIKKRKAIKL